MFHFTHGFSHAPSLWLAGFVRSYWLKWNNSRRKWANQHNHIQVAQWLLCPLLMRACTVRGWDDFKVHETYGGADSTVLDMCSWLIIHLCLWVWIFHMNMCVFNSERLFSHMCSRDMRALCSRVYRQEVGHSCSRAEFISDRILCSFTSTHLCPVFFFSLCFSVQFQVVG